MIEMTQEQIDARSEKIRQYYANEPAEKRAERIEKIKAYHRTIHRKKAIENRARVAREEIKNVIATLRYIIGESDTPTPTDNE
ncbi:MAG: hypothetical protein IJK84_04450 [Bacteroidales bacterium]|nr:hypothetical protein [Bacteroidales bacterium]MBQ6068733.1 hypothetical protein [Bacteroidales bacterium]